MFHVEHFAAICGNPAGSGLNCLAFTLRLWGILFHVERNPFFKIFITQYTASFAREWRPEMAPGSKSASSKSRLGRGLSSLIGNTIDLHDTGGQEYQHVTGLPPISQGASEKPAPAPRDAQAAEIPIDQIAPNPYQPRESFSVAELAELTESIRQQGILQPLVLAPAGDREDKPYVLVAGERRLRAARQAGLTSVPAIVRKATKQQMLEWALVENIQRSDLNPIERARAYYEYIRRFDLTQAEAAQRLGQPRATIANYLRMLDLHGDIQRMLVDGRLTFGHAKALASLAGMSDKQLAMAKQAVAKRWSVRQLEAHVAESLAENKADEAISARGKRAKAPYIRDLEDRLSQAVGTRVSIRPGRAKNTGKLVIDYYSLDDFERITTALGLRQEPL